MSLSPGGENVARIGDQIPESIRVTATSAETRTQHHLLGRGAGIALGLAAAVLLASGRWPRTQGPGRAQGRRPRLRRHEAGLHIARDDAQPERARRSGRLFAHHHPVYLSSTEVNGTAIATGAYPSRSTVIANVDFRPAIDAQKPIGIEVPANVRRGDEVSGGRYLGAPTVAEILHARGRRTVVAGTKLVALLHDRAAGR